MDTDALVKKITCEIGGNPNPKTPEKLEKILCQFSVEPQFICKHHLIMIASEKNGGKLAPSKSGKALESNGEESVKYITSLSFRCENPETQMRLLLGLSGVRVPVASCILAWTHPTRYGVIDKKSCGAIDKITGKTFNPQSVLDWVCYLDIIQSVARCLEITPMMVDRRLYAFAKT